VEADQAPTLDLERALKLLCRRAWLVVVCGGDADEYGYGYAYRYALAPGATGADEHAR
jgi:hypothetical protein